MHNFRKFSKYSRVKGIADHYWPWPVFLFYSILSRAADPKGMMSFRMGEEFSSIPRGQELSKGNWGPAGGAGSLEQEGLGPGEESEGLGGI